MIVINKPAGVPVHPTGRYNFNSVVEIMRAERGGGWTPMPCNRLDRLTSGIMFVGKHKEAAEKLSVQIRGRTVRKEYIARVIGKFPDGEIICEQPILQISPKLGLNRVRANGKEAKTVFRRLAYYPSDASEGENHMRKEMSNGSSDPLSNGLPWRRKDGYSIVRCRPDTGRTHQIRVHLQFLGHPISNDPIYCNQRVFGIDLGMGDDDASRDEDVMSRLAKMGKSEAAETIAYHEEIAAGFQQRRSEKLTGQSCEVCETPLYSDPGLHELGIYLHARRYACAEGRWEYETSLPGWAMPPPGIDGPTDATTDTDPLATDLESLKLDSLVASVKRISNNEAASVGSATVV